MQSKSKNIITVIGSPIPCKLERNQTIAVHLNKLSNAMP